MLYFVVCCPPWGIFVSMPGLPRDESQSVFWGANFNRWERGESVQDDLAVLIDILGRTWRSDLVAKELRYDIDR